MKKFAKKLFSIVMVLCIVCGTIFILPVSAAVSDIQLGTPTLAVIQGNESYYCDMRFTPTESGTYVFRSESNSDTYASILNAEGEEVAFNDDGGVNLNFLVFCEMTAGETYTLRPKFLNDSGGSFIVTLSKFDVVSLSVDNISVAQGLDTYITTDWDFELEQNVEWEYYNYSVNDYALNLADGTAMYCSGSFEYNDDWYWLSVNDTQSYKTSWKVGNTYTATAEIMGFTDTFTITVTANPAQSLEIQDITLTHGFDNTTMNYWDDEKNCEVQYDYYYYMTNFAVTLNDGTVLNSECESVDYNNMNYYIWVTPTQSYANQWKPGNTYTLTGEVMGVTDTFTVTILENPVKNIEIDNITLTEGFDSHLESYWNKETNCEGKWRKYDYQPTFTVNFKDGSSVQSDEHGTVYINETGYSLSFEDDQTLINQWVAGNTYTATGIALGFEDTFEITIEETPFASVDIKDVTVIVGDENKQHKMHENIETGEFYDWDAYVYFPDFTVTLKDGTVLEGDRGDIIYNDDWYSIESIDNQSPTNVWGIGTHTATGEIFGVQDTFNVTIIECPVKSISVKPISLQEYTNGYTDTYWNDYEYVSYYVYDWHEHVRVTVEFIDGSVKTYGYWDDIEYNGNHLDLAFSFSQNPYNPWIAGNTYYEEVYLGEQSTTATITITESPYKSLEILSVDPIKETDYHWIDEYGNKHYYTPNFTYKINFKDGTSLIREYYNYYEDHRITVSYSDYDNPWTVGGENLVTVSIGKTSTSFSAIITEVKAWEYIEQNGGIFITNCSLSDENLVVPDTIDGKTVIGIMSLGDCLKSAKTITLPDSVTYLSTGAFACEYWIRLETINIGKNISELNSDTFAYCDSLSSINVSGENKTYCTIDGIVYSKAGDTLVVYPLGQGYTYNVPDNVSNVDVLYNKVYYSDITINFSENSKAFKEVDGITYNADMTTVISCDVEKTGSYVMPDSVTNIAAYAFSNSQLSSVTVSKNVTHISYYSFSYCENLETIALPDTLTSIGDHAFADTSLKSIVIPSSVTDIDNSAFVGSALEKLTLSEGLEYIGSSAFAGTHITSLTIPDSVTQMGSFAFANTPLETLSVGSGLSIISSGAFYNTSLTNLTLPKNIEYIDNNAFAYSSISKIVFKADEVYIGDRAFENCPLDNTTLSNNIMGFGAFAFSGSSMTSVKIPDSVTNITYYSFAYSQDLATIDIPDNIERIDGHAFDRTAWYEAQEDGVVYLENVLYHYKGDIPENTEIVVKSGTIAIADYAFEMEYKYWDDGSIWRDVSGLKSVTLPTGLKTIGTNAFFDCINLEKIVIPESVVSIEWDAFRGCENLTIYGYEGSYAETYANQNGIPFVALVEKSTEDANVILSPDAIDPDAKFIVENIPFDNISQMLEGMEFTGVKAFDIYFELNGVVVQPDGTVTVELKVPEGFNGAYCNVYHISDDGKVANMNATFNDGKLIFKTDHFSLYAIVENKPAYTSGDVNDDGAINNKDLGILMQYLNGWDVTINADAADVNRDGNTNNKDYGLLMQYSNGWDVKLQ